MRLCYAGTVVQATPESMIASRTPLSVGAELFGDASARADIEIVSLMVEAMRSLGLENLHIDLGDVSIFRQFMDGLDLDADQRDLLFDLVQRKAVAELRREGAAMGLAEESFAQLCALPELCGDESMLQDARDVFSDSATVCEAIDNLTAVATELKGRFDGLDIYFDLSELRGYGYHTGIVFAAYVRDHGEVIAKGGRYDDVGQVFGRQGRAATGFSINVINLMSEVTNHANGRKRVGLGEIDSASEAGVWQEMQRLRQEGYIVIEDETAEDVDLKLVGENGQYRLVDV